jgi:hypothetical protein
MDRVFSSHIGLGKLGFSYFGAAEPKPSSARLLNNY